MGFPKGFFLLHDSDGREDETDLCVPAELVEPAHILTMRKRAGGLICLALQKTDAEQLGLKFMADMLGNCNPGSGIYKRTAYGDYPAFSVSVNHRECRTGISDVERALTVRKLFELISQKRFQDFKKEFLAPGHMHLLISRGIENRNGHTELSIEYSRQKGFYPMAVICEMLADDGKRLGKTQAQEFANGRGIKFAEGCNILKKAKA